MKVKIIFIGLLMVLVAGHSQAQVKPQSEIQTTSVVIANANSGAKITLTAPESTVINAFGKPSGTELMPWETEPDDIYAYAYNGNIIYIDRRRITPGTEELSFWGFRLRNANHCLIYGSATIKVGDSITTLKSIFPTSYSNRHSKVIVVRLTYPDNSRSDYSVDFYYNQSTNLITEIIVGPPPY